MSNPPEDIRQWIQDLISRSATDQMQNLQRFGEMLRKTSRGEIDQETLREEYLRFAREESTRYINDLTRVGLSFYNTLLELNRHYNDRFFEHVYRDGRVQSGPAAPEKVGPRVVEMELHAPLGEEAVRSFIIENQKTEPISVSFLVSEFFSEKDGTTFRPPLKLSPARFTMRPGEEKQITIQVPLLPEFFVPEQVYTATVIVSGYEVLQLRLKVWADRVQEKAIGAQRSPEPRESFKPTFRPVPENGSSPAPDDLAQIKGIGPVYQRKLQEGGICTFDQLATADEGTLERLLGSRVLPRAQREKWQKQAHLAAAGDQAALHALQQKLG